MSEICHHIIQLLRQTKYVFFRIKNQIFFPLSLAKTSDNILARSCIQRRIHPPPRNSILLGDLLDTDVHIQNLQYLFYSLLSLQNIDVRYVSSGTKTIPIPQEFYPPFLKILHPSLIKRTVRETFVASGRKL